MDVITYAYEQQGSDAPAAPALPEPANGDVPDAA